MTYPRVCRLTHPAGISSEPFDLRFCDSRTTSDFSWCQQHGRGRFRVPICKRPSGMRATWGRTELRRLSSTAWRGWQWHFLTLRTWFSYVLVSCVSSRGACLGSPTPEKGSWNVLVHRSVLPRSKSWWRGNRSWAEWGTEPRLWGWI